jgi:hypothetical protein
MLSAITGKFFAIGIFIFIDGQLSLQGKVVFFWKVWFSKTNSSEQLVIERKSRKKISTRRILRYQYN